MSHHRLKPSALYLQCKQQRVFTDDPKQNQAVELFDLVAEELSRTEQRYPFFRRRKSYVNGVYLWGGVGRGKTMLMDIFYESAPLVEKKRVHFHRFMASVHDQLNQLKEIQSPLAIIAKRIARECRLLCLDEFHVNDIADAMVLGTLIAALFTRGVTLVTTSNRAPDDLYKNGLQRARFIPAIELIKAHCRVFQLDNQTDYRLLTLQQTKTYFTPLGKVAEQNMQRCFHAITTRAISFNQNITVNHRPITAWAYAEDVIWFEFGELCKTPRSKEDYLDIATEYQSVFLSNVPTLDDQDNDAVRRLLILIDVLYDHRVKLIVSAAQLPEKLYQGRRLKFEFNRACSRLIEMQSETYMARAHV